MNALIGFHASLLIGTAELNGWQFTGGEFTGPGAVDLAVSSSPVAEALNLGPGMRLVICDKIDCGVGTAFAVTRGLNIGNSNDAPGKGEAGDGEIWAFFSRSSLHSAQGQRSRRYGNG